MYFSRLLQISSTSFATNHWQQNKELSTQRFAKSRKHSTVWCGMLAGSTARAAGWCVASQHTAARTRQMLQQQQSVRKEKVVACKRKGDRKKHKWSCHQELFLGGNTWVHGYLPFQQILTAPHTETVTRDRGQPPRAAAHTRESSIFFLALTFLLVFYFFTNTKDLNGKMDFFSS